jgi:hypothetical protein
MAGRIEALTEDHLAGCAWLNGYKISPEDIMMARE